MKRKLKAKKPRIKAIEHRVETVDIEFKQKGQKRRLLRIQRYRNPLRIKDIDLSKNPDKIIFGGYRTSNSVLEIFGYKNNPEKVFISVNGEVIGADAIDWRRINKGILKSGKYLGVMK